LPHLLVDLTHLLALAVLLMLRAVRRCSALPSGERLLGLVVNRVDALRMDERHEAVEAVLRVRLADHNDVLFLRRNEHRHILANHQVGEFAELAAGEVVADAQLLTAVRGPEAEQARGRARGCDGRWRSRSVRHSGDLWNCGGAGRRWRRRRGRCAATAAGDVAEPLLDAAEALFQ